MIDILLNLYSCLCNLIPECNLQNLGNISRIFLVRMYSLNSGENMIQILICSLQVSKKVQFFSVVITVNSIFMSTAGLNKLK